MLSETLLQRVIPRFVSRGSLDVATASGRVLTFGDGTPPHVRVRLTDRAAEWALLLDAELKLGELYMDGRLVIEEGSLLDLLQLATQDNGGDRYRLPFRALLWLRLAWRRIATLNDPERSRHNVAHHYDLDEAFYRLFLDPDMQYSCAYFEGPDQSLADAQRAKKRHIAAKLLVEPQHRVLDIGCGWGGLGLYLVETARARSVKGITLSREQAAVASRRAAERGLEGLASFAIEDYRKTRGAFDRIVSVGMFEHVGPPQYATFFRHAARLLAPDGVMLLHTIGHTGEPDYTNPWITRYIFPGGHLPTLSEVMPAIERSGLAVTDVEVLRLHYAETLRAWREAFLSRRAAAARMFDERFCRMWEFYLALSEAAFRWQDVVVFQIQLARRNDVVPLTRDYIGEREARLRAAERDAGRHWSQVAE